MPESFQIKLSIIIFLISCSLLAFFIIRTRRNKKANLLKDDYKQTSSWFLAILEATNDGIVIFDAKSNIFRHNQEFIKIWNLESKWNRGVENEKLFNQITSQIINKEDFIYQTKHIQGPSLERQHLILELLNGQSFAMYALAFDVNGEKNGTLWSFRDISKRKIVEDELRKLSSAVEYSPVSVVITDMDGNIEYVNPNFTKLTGYSQLEVAGKNPRMLKSGTQTGEFYKNLWDTIKSGDTWHGEFHNRKKNGELYWETASISPIIDNGKITHFVAVKSNVTELKKAYEELMKREKELKDLIATKDKFFSIVAHDLRNPFHSLIGFTELILNNPGKFSPEKILDYIKIISKTAKSGYNLLENMLFWARSQTGKLQYSPEKINIKEITNEVIELSNTSIKNKDLKIVVKINDNISAFADKNTITTVIRNLISNAIKYSNNNGKVEISSSIQHNNILFSVKDEGVGIEQPAIDNLFNLDSNYSTPGTNQEKGTGLGLILCKDFVEHNGGKIWLESELNKGTCFYFTIPLN